MARAGAKIIYPRSVEEAGTQGKADRVLLDVPCSGTGAWRRRPETRWLLSENNLHDYNKLQDELLKKGSDLTSKNGTLIYVTCSVLESEGEDRIEAFLGRTPGFEVVNVDRLWSSVLDGVRPDRGPFVNLSPATCGTDGFFVAVLRNTA
jgi:16S rRNA (cytosine967-C5)-methyltransferase